MGCCGGRRDDDLAHVSAEQKWDYINLNDFKSHSCWPGVSYVILYLTVLKSFAVYGVDTFTAINLLAFSRWASQIKPAISFDISKWIFAGCIILSFVLLIYRWLRAIRVMKSGGVAQSYLDPIAVRLQSMRMGESGHGYRRFLVFASLTKSRKGADYVALFTYFNFEAWLRVIFAEGPRQVINAQTLYSVLQANLIPAGKHAASKGTSDFEQFFINIKILADKDVLQATILSAMLFTLVIWVFSMLSLGISVILYLMFLWHHIPSEDGSLSVYCRRKINQRLERIVKAKVDKALSKGVPLQDRRRMDPESGMVTGTIKTQPTLPTFDYGNNSQAPMPGISRTTTATTATTLPSYFQPETPVVMDSQPKLPDLKGLAMGGPPPNSRISDDTEPLVGNAGGFGYSSPAPYQPNAPVLPPVERTGTPLSLTSGMRPPTSQSRRTPGPQTPGPMESVGRRTPGPQTPGPGPDPGYPFPRAPPSAASRRTPGPQMPPDRSRTPGALTPGPESMRNSPRPIPPPGHMDRGSPAPGGHYPPRAGTVPPPEDGHYPPRSGTAPPPEYGHPRYNQF